MNSSETLIEWDLGLVAERKALIEADNKLEAVQDYLRGATRVKGIRKDIRKRLEEIEREMLPETRAALANATGKGESV